MEICKKTAQEQCLIFLHIPKTAGSTLHNIINNQYESDQIFNLGEGTQESICKFRQISEQQKKDLKVIKGHMTFGLHKFLPQKSIYITMLRNPIERIISSYYFILSQPYHRHYEYVASQNMSLRDYAASELLTDNAMTKLIAGMQVGHFGGTQKAEFKQDSSLFILAKKNIRDYFLLVGDTDKFDESILILRKRLDWKIPLYVKNNTTPNRPSVKDISENTVKIIQNRNKLDIDLYKYGKNLLEMQITQKGDDFIRELKMFKHINKIYNYYKKIKGYSIYLKNIMKKP